MAAFTRPFWPSKKEIQGPVSGRIRVWLFRYHAGCQRRATGGHVNPFNDIDEFGFLSCHFTLSFLIESRPV